MLYFIQRPSDGAIKIGFSNSFKQRMTQLRGEHKEEMRVLGVVKGDREDERMLHAIFVDLNISGEWFRDDEEIRYCMESLEPMPIEEAMKISASRRYSISISDEVFAWLKQQVDEKRFRSISHGVEYCIVEIMKRKK